MELYIDALSRLDNSSASYCSIMNEDYIQYGCDGVDIIILSNFAENSVVRTFHSFVMIVNYNHGRADSIVDLITVVMRDWAKPDDNTDLSRLGMDQIATEILSHAGVNPVDIYRFLGEVYDMADDPHL